jgi:hypothetical protein
MDDSLYGPDNGLPEPDQYPDTSFTQPLEDENAEEDYDEMDDFGEQYDLWAQQAEAQKKPALFQMTTTTLGEGRAGEDEMATAERVTSTGEGLTTGDRFGPARHQPSQGQQRTGQNPLLKKLTQQAAAGAARSTTPDGFPRNLKKPSSLTYNPVKQAAQKTDFHLPPLSTLAMLAQAANKKRPRSLREPKTRGQPGMPDDSEDGEADATAALDYAEEQLRAMPYAELQAEPFDAPAPGPDDPAAADDDGNAATAAKDGGEGKETVAARVAAGMAATPEQQELAFNAMSLPEWEEAGEWFVGRFADVVGRMAEVRARKRRAAQEAEAAIAARSAAVEAGERETRVVLAGMKEQGREILRRRGQD